MKYSFVIFSFFTLAILCACVTKKQESDTGVVGVRPIYEGWENLYRGDPDLAGVIFLHEGESPDYLTV